MGKQASTPAAPDPKEMARLQGIEDRKALRMNLDASRTSTVNPFGKTSWSNNPTFDQAGFDQAMAAYKPTGGSGLIGGLIQQNSAPDRSEFMHDNWTNTQELSKESQGIYDTATSKLGEATNNISTDATRYNQDVADAIQRRMTRYTDPAMKQARNDMQTNLADRGFQVGNEGFNNEMTRLDDSQNQSRADIADRAQITGAQQGLQELSMQQQIAQSLQNLRGAQVAGVSSMPSTTTAPQQNAFDISGAMMNNYQNAVQSANAQNASSNALLGSALGAGAMMLGGPAGGAVAGSLLPSMAPMIPAGLQAANYSLGRRNF